MVAVGAAAKMPVFRPLAGDDKLEILELARRIGTYEISAEPFHDCCPVYLPRVPALHATVEDLDAAEATMASASEGAATVEALTRQGVKSATVERFEYSGGQVSETKGGKKVKEAIRSS